MRAIAAGELHRLRTNYTLVWRAQAESGVITNVLTLNIIFAQDKSHVSQSCVFSVRNISKHKQGELGSQDLVNIY